MSAALLFWKEQKGKVSRWAWSIAEYGFSRADDTAIGAFGDPSFTLGQR